MTDPRASIIDERLKDVRTVVAVSGGKGGVGKSLIASMLAVSLAEKGYRVGLFDLDFTSPSTHVILGVGDLQPTEEKGIVPPEIHGLKYMSIIYYSGEQASPLRGADVSNALIELLAVTLWGHLDYLIIDMPPGISDATLDMIRLVKNVQFLVVTTPSQLAFETAKKLIALLKDLKVSVVGVIENMKRQESRLIQRQVEAMSIKYLGPVPYDAEVEDAIGDTDKLSETKFAKKIQEITTKTFC